MKAIVKVRKCSCGEWPTVVDGDGYFVLEHCGQSTDLYGLLDDAVAAWNRSKQGHEWAIAA